MAQIGSFRGEQLLEQYETLSGQTQSQVKEIAAHMVENLMETLAYMIEAQQLLANNAAVQRYEINFLYESWRDEILSNSLKAKRQMLRSMSDFKFNVGNIRGSDLLFNELDRLGDNLRFNTPFRQLDTSKSVICSFLTSTASIICGEVSNNMKPENTKEANSSVRKPESKTLNQITNTYNSEACKVKVPGLNLNSVASDLYCKGYLQTDTDARERKNPEGVKRKNGVRSYAASKKSGSNSKENSQKCRENSQLNSIEKTMTTQAKDIQICEFQTESLMELSANRCLSPNNDRDEKDSAMINIGFSERQPSSRFEVAIVEDTLIPNHKKSLSTYQLYDHQQDYKEGDILSNYLTFSNQPQTLQAFPLPVYNSRPEDAPMFSQKKEKIEVQIQIEEGREKTFDLQKMFGSRKAMKINVNVGMIFSFRKYREISDF